MAFVELMNYGTPPGSPGAALCTLGRSPGINDPLARELTRLCQGWGPRPLNDDMRPALLSFPLKTAVKFAPSGAYAVIKVSTQPEFHFQIAVLNQGDYANFGYNPFAVVAAGALPEWDPTIIPGRRTLTPPTGPLSVSPPPSPEDVGLIDEALVQLLASHKLYLPIEATNSRSDRFLALLIEVAPEALKQQLRFASFAPSPANGYHLAATETQGCDYSGWHRLMTSLVSSQLPDHLDSYVKKVRDCLAYGDVSVVKGESRRLSLDQRRQSPAPLPSPAPKAKAKPNVSAAVARKKVTQVRKKPVPNSGNRPQMAQWRGSKRQLSAPVVVLLVLGLTLAGGWTYLQFFHDGDGIAWNELVGGSAKTGQAPVASLLEVPNVGAIYERQMKSLRRASMIPGLSLVSDGQKNLEKLKSEAGIPLIRQLDLFLDLAGSGIKQGQRPDRENERMRALAHQGGVLKIELTRLELAWFSLSSGTHWQDLSRLSDKAVLARRDSLSEKSPGALKVAAKDLQLGDRRKDLLYAEGQVRGMSQLLKLFLADQYSEQWARDLYRAAESVSPRASTITRAYRNSAFTFVRLKKAERSQGFSEQPFVADWTERQWPSAAVKDILPNLRRELGRFATNEAPVVLAGTVALYHVLENPDPTVGLLAKGKTSLDKLQTNVAYQFDPAVYGDYLERLRYEAAMKTNPDRRDDPDLYKAAHWEEVLAFESMRRRNSDPAAWERVGEEKTNPFLKRWAFQLKNQGQQDVLASMGQFEKNWSQAVEMSARLDRLALDGQDWTAVWVDLKKVLDQAVVAGFSLVEQGGIYAERYTLLKQLDRRLHQRAVLELGQVTVRMTQEHLASSQKAICEFRALPDGPILRSEPFTIGPAAPAGSGWVGTVFMAGETSVAADQGFSVTILTADRKHGLLEVIYPSLADRVGPGALARPRTGEGGSLSIRTGGNWWRALRLPSLVPDPGAL